MIDGSELILKLEHSAEWDQVTASFPMIPWRAGNYVDGLCRRHDQHFDSIFVVRPLPVYVEDLDKPPINVAYQQQVQFLIEGAAVRAESHCYVHWVTLTDFETRRSMVNGLLKERMADIQTMSQSIQRL